METLKIRSILTAEELPLAENYITRGGAFVSKARATAIAKAFGKNTPRHGYEIILEETDHEKTILKYEGEKYNVRIYTSVNAPWLRR